MSNKSGKSNMLIRPWTLIQDITTNHQRKRNMMGGCSNGHFHCGIAGTHHFILQPRHVIVILIAMRLLPITAFTGAATMLVSLRAKKGKSMSLLQFESHTRMNIIMKPLSKVKSTQIRRWAGRPF